MPKELNEKKIRKEERKKIGKRKRAKGTLYTMFGALIAFLISIFSGLFGLDPIGFYGDGSGSHSIIKQLDNEEGVPEEAVEATTVGEQATGTESITIVVEGDSYLYKDQAYDLEGITLVISELQIDGPINLVDKSATYKAYDQVKMALTDHGHEYTLLKDLE